MKVDPLGDAVTEKPKNNQSFAPVFIVGGSRTGSEMLKTMLSAGSDLDFVDELFLICPRWLHKDLATNLREQVGNMDSPKAHEKIIHLLYSGIPYGWFWSVVGRELDESMMRAELAGKSIDLREIFQAIMTVHAKSRGKGRIGAKFPLHYSFTHKLLEWYPDCRIIHTTRNPKAVYASQAAKYLRAEQGAISRNTSRFQQFVHINIQTTWTARLHRRYCGLSNYRLVRYEDIVSDPGRETAKLCNFLEIDFHPEMIRPNQYGSSFGEIGMRRGIEVSSLERWKKSLSKTSVFVMDLLHHGAYKQLGYSGEDGQA